MARARIEVSTVKNEVAIPHWGVTLRTVFGAVLEAWPDAAPGECRDFKLIHKDKDVGTIHVRQHSIESN